MPGIFGFIVWELKENWRLYAANRAGRLTPVVLGHHGETMRGLLRPGFHSGTVPSLYRKLRQAARKQSLSTEPVVAGQLVHGLEEVSHAVELFVHRELEPLLRTDGPDSLAIRCEEVHVDAQTIEVALGEEQFGPPYLRLAFDHHDGRITARLVDPGWMAKANPEQSAALRFALEGFCRMANATPPAEWATASADGPTWDEWEASGAGRTVRADPIVAFRSAKGRAAKCDCQTHLRDEVPGPTFRGAKGDDEAPSAMKCACYSLAAAPFGSSVGVRFRPKRSLSR